MRKCHRTWEWSGEPSSLLTMDRAFAAFRHVNALGSVIRDSRAVHSGKYLVSAFHIHLHSEQAQRQQGHCFGGRGDSLKTSEFVLCTLSHELTKSAGEREQFVHYAIAMDDQIER